MTPVPDSALPGALWAVTHGRSSQPHDVLGQHLEPSGLRVRVRRPLATRVRVRFEDDVVIDLAHESDGIFSGVRPDATRTMDYRVLTTWQDGIEHVGDDAYRFVPTLGEVDLHLIGEGRQDRGVRQVAALSPERREERSREGPAAPGVEAQRRRGRDPLPLGVVSTTLAASTDFGNVSFRLPGIHPMIRIADPDTALHTREFAKAATSDLARSAAADGAYGLAVGVADHRHDLRGTGRVGDHRDE